MVYRHEVHKYIRLKVWDKVRILSAATVSAIQVQLLAFHLRSGVRQVGKDGRVILNDFHRAPCRQVALKCCTQHRSVILLLQAKARRCPEKLEWCMMTLEVACQRLKECNQVMRCCVWLEFMAFIYSTDGSFATNVLRGWLLLCTLWFHRERSPSILFLPIQI